MAIRSKEQIITDAITFIKSRVTNIATEVGSVIRDIVIESPAEEFDEVYTELERIQKINSVNFPDDATEEELDALGANYGLLRKSGTAAVGTITFQVRDFSTTSSPITVPVGTTLATTGSDGILQVTFVTTEALFFDPALAPTLFNPLTGLYELTSNITAETIGLSGNVTAGTITVLSSSVPGITSVVNTTATTGGEDIETNTAFAARIQVKLSGNNVGTVNGIISLLNANDSVIDSIVVTPNDVEMIRDEFGGEVDAYIIGQNLTSIIDIFLYQSLGSQEFVLLHQPAKSVVSVTGIAGAVPTTFISGVDYNFVLDTSTLVNGSTRLQNKIVFNIGGTNPDDATNITVTYLYNKTIEDLQLQIDADDGQIVTADVLVKEADEVDIDITADVTLFPGNTGATEINNIQTAITQFINALGLGDSINRSDIVGVIEDVPSVDAVDLSTLVLVKDGVPLPSNEQRLVVFKSEFPRASIITINII